MVARNAATEFVDTLYKVTYEGAGSIPFSSPFITSFCSHSADQSYEQENGLLSQWRGYGGDGGYCIVFDTAALGALLGKEFDTYYWVHLNISPVHYATDDVSIKELFPTLLDRFDAFFSATLDQEPHEVPGDGFASFATGTTLFKHQGFREEREVRIVAMPGTRELAEHVAKEYPDFTLTSLKTTHTIDGARGTKHYVILFDGIGIALPIKRIIVGPSRHQAENYERACRVAGSGIAVGRSRTPFIG